MSDQVVIQIKKNMMQIVFYITPPVQTQSFDQTPHYIELIYLAALALLLFSQSFTLNYFSIEVINQTHCYFELSSKGQWCGPQRFSTNQIALDCSLLSLFYLSKLLAWGVFKTSTANSSQLTFKHQLPLPFPQKSTTIWLKQETTNLCWTIWFSTTAQTGSWKDPSIEMHRRSPKSNQFEGLNGLNSIFLLIIKL